MPVRISASVEYLESTGAVYSPFWVVGEERVDQLDASGRNALGGSEDEFRLD